MLGRSVSRSILSLVALYTAAGGYVHMQEWLDGYRNIPSGVPGSWVVRVGFPVNAAAAAIVAVALVVAAVRRRGGVPALLAAVGLSAGTLSMLIATRTGSVFGWAEPVWTSGANQARAVAIGALVLAAMGAVTAVRPVKLPSLVPARVAANR